MPRSEIFRDIIVALDSSAGEAREGGLEGLASYIEDALIEFCKDELMLAEVAEMRE